MSLRFNRWVGISSKQWIKLYNNQSSTPRKVLDWDTVKTRFKRRTKNAPWEIVKLKYGIEQHRNMKYFCSVCAYHYNKGMLERLPRRYRACFGCHMVNPPPRLIKLYGKKAEVAMLNEFIGREARKQVRKKTKEVLSETIF